MTPMAYGIKPPVEPPVYGEEPAITKGISKPMFGGNHPNISEEDKKLLNELLVSNVKFDNKKAKDIILNVSKKTGLSPEFISASALQEGMNLAIRYPDEVSQSYVDAKIDEKYPIDGFYNYGLDTFGDAYEKLKSKGYLPKDFDYKPYKAINEKRQMVNTAAFKNNEDALMAKAAYLRDFMDSVKDVAKKSKLELNDRALKYFTVAAYNGGIGSVMDMINEMKDSGKTFDEYVKEGSKKRANVHKSASSRMDKMDYLSSLFLDKNL